MRSSSSGAVLGYGARRTQRRGMMNRHQVAGGEQDNEEGRFAANAILCLVGIGLIVTGVGLLGSTSERGQQVNAFNQAADHWEASVRQRFEAVTFKLLFVQCPTCDPVVTVEFHPDSSGTVRSCLTHCDR